MGKRRKGLEQLPLFASTAPPPPPATDARAAEAARKKTERDKARRAYFAGRARGRAESPPAPATVAVDPEVREKVLNLLSADSARIAKVARAAKVPESVVRELVADEFDRRKAVREAVDITRALEREPVTRRTPRRQRCGARVPCCAPRSPRAD